jgi:hypothetical protein
MKAISIQQPWAWLIVNGYKDIENRDWPTRVRGRIQVHASKTFDGAGYKYVAANFPHIPLPDPKAFQRGGVVGETTITDCTTGHKSPWFFGDFGFVLTDSKPVDFIPCQGALGFFVPKIAAST